MTRTSRGEFLKRAGLVGAAVVAGEALTADAATPRAAGPIVSLADHGAVGDGKTDDTSALMSWQDAVAGEAAAHGGAVAFVPPGTYLTTQTIDKLLDTGVLLKGCGEAASVIRLADNSNVPLMQTAGFQSNTGKTIAGPSQFGIESITLDGNGVANQATGTWTIQIYGYNYWVDHVTFMGGAAGNVYSEFNDPGVHAMEAHWSNFRILDAIGLPASAGSCYGLWWRGPHDSQFQNGSISTLAAAQVGQGPSIAVLQDGQSSAEYFTNIHVWGRHHWGWVTLSPFDGLHCANCVAEGALVNVVVLSSGFTWTGGEVYGTNGAGGMVGQKNEVGFMIGAGTDEVSRARFASEPMIAAVAKAKSINPYGLVIAGFRVWSFTPPGVAWQFPTETDGTDAGGNYIHGVVRAYADGLIGGYPSPTDDIVLVNEFGNATVVQRAGAQWQPLTLSANVTAASGYNPPAASLRDNSLLFLSGVFSAGAELTAGSTVLTLPAVTGTGLKGATSTPGRPSLFPTTQSVAIATNLSAPGGVVPLAVSPSGAITTVAKIPSGHQVSLDGAVIRVN